MSSCHKGVHYLCVTLRMRRRMKGPGDSLVTHIHNLLSSALLMLPFSWFLLPHIHMLSLHLHRLLSAWFCAHWRSAYPISSLINAIDAVNKPHRHVFVADVLREESRAGFNVQYVVFVRATSLENPILENRVYFIMLWNEISGGAFSLTGLKGFLKISPNT